MLKLCNICKNPEFWGHKEWCPNNPIKYEAL